MQILHGLDATHEGPAVVTIGAFDGVHRGHAKLHARVLEEARRVGADGMVITFDPHPLEVLAPERAPCLLTTLDQRLGLFAQEGMAATLVLPFTEELSSLEPGAFVRSVLLDRVHARKVIVGEDFRFGHARAGDAGTLARLGTEHGFEVETYPLVDGNGGKVSSSVIRKHIAAGDVEAAAELLGRSFRLAGTVVRGEKRGRKIGFPTANLEPQPRACLPSNGVYAAWWVDPGRRLPGVVNVGIRPTFEPADRPVPEIHIFDFDEDLYGARGEIEFTSFLRPELKFGSVDELVDQIRQDAARAREILGAQGPDRV